MKPKIRTQESLNAELGLIIDEFGRAMRNANRDLIAREPDCSYHNGIYFTLAMETAWQKYKTFCWAHPDA